MAVAISQTDDVSGVATTSFVATYSSVSIGAAASDRVVAVACTSRLMPPISATINYGSGAVAMHVTSVAFDDFDGIDIASCIFYLAVPTGTTATITITYSSTDDDDGARNHIVVYRVTGTSDALNNSGTDVSSFMVSDPLTTGSITIPASGGFLAGICTGTTFDSYVWTNATGAAEANTGLYRYGTATRVSSGTVTVSCSDPDFITGAMAWVIFAPSGAQNINAGFFGAGTLSVSTTSAQQIGARFAGAGNLRTALTGLGDQFGSAGFSGSGNLRVDTRFIQSTRTVLAGRGDFQVNVAYGALAARTRLNGVGSLSVETIYVAAPLPVAPPALVAGEWPEERLLPQCPILNGFSEQRQRNVIEFQPEVGSTKLHRRNTVSNMQASVVFRMTDTEVDTFNQWYVDYQEDGTLEFTWDHPVTKVNYSWMFDPKEAPRIERMTPNTFRVSFNLLRLD